MSKRTAQSAQSPSVKEIRRKVRRHMPELRRRYGVTYLGVFGSRLRGEQGKTSDLDVLVEFNENGPTLFGFVALENYLSDLLGVKVDLVEKGTLKPAIGKHILEEVQPI